ncbi:MAG: hypothetical protein WCY93_12205 [Anaerolineaceae bacterium]
MNTDLSFEVEKIVEHEDGSATITAEVGSGMQEFLVNEGLLFVLIKEILGLNSDEIIKLADAHKELTQEHADLKHKHEAFLSLMETALDVKK